MNYSKKESDKEKSFDKKLSDSNLSIEHSFLEKEEEESKNKKMGTFDYIKDSSSQEILMEKSLLKVKENMSRRRSKTENQIELTKGASMQYISISINVPDKRKISKIFLQIHLL